jgi:hypothetical protein
MYRIIALALLVLLTGCATHRPAQPEVLVAPSYTVFVWSNCPEGEVGCSHLSGELKPTGTRKKVRLTGSTYMVKCADGITPCHIGYYKLVGAGFTVLAYPDGRLELSPPLGSSITETGDWLEY